MAKSQAEFDSEMAELKIQREKLELQDLQEKLEERQMRKNNQKSTFISRGRALDDTRKAEDIAQSQCTHRKGGPGHLFKSGGGNDVNFSVIKHTLPNRDILVMCTRCQRKWLPPIEPKKTEFRNVAEYDAAMETYKAELSEYRTALAFLTDNSPSGGATFLFPDGGQACREAMQNS